MFNLPTGGENHSAKRAATHFATAKRETDAKAKNDALIDGLIELAKAVQELSAAVHKRQKKGAA
jgi:hypothetical protein